MGVADRTTGALGRQEPLTVESILPILDALLTEEPHHPTEILFSIIGGDLWLRKQKLRKKRRRCGRNVYVHYVGPIARWCNTPGLAR